MIRWVKKLWKKIQAWLNPQSDVDGKGNNPNPPNLEEQKK